MYTTDQVTNKYTTPSFPDDQMVIAKDEDDLSFMIRK